MISAAEELERKTLVYWKMSQVWNGRRAIKVPVGEAIEICQGLYDMVSFYRPLAHRTDGLLQEIIKGEGNKLPPAKIYTLPTKKQGATK